MCALFTSVEKVIRLAPSRFGQQVGGVAEILPEIASKRFVIFGEEHGKLPVINFQSQIIKQMLAQNSDQEAKLNIVMEHFSFEMQHLLDQYGGWGVAAIAVLPLPLAVGTWSAGSLKVSARQVSVALLLRVPKTVVYVLMLERG